MTPFNTYLGELEVHDFLTGISVKAIAGLEFELIYFDASVHYFNHYTTLTITPSEILLTVGLMSDIGYFWRLLVLKDTSIYFYSWFLMELL